MSDANDYRIQMGEAGTSDARPMKREQRAARNGRAKALVSAASAVRALKATVGAGDVIARVPSLAAPRQWLPTASFTVCRKTGTATYLDIWDADHFDGYTDTQKCVADCRAWFSADGYSFWDAPQTKTGRINCYFQAPTAGNYVCTVQLQSDNGPARVECLIDAFNYGPLPFNGAKTQPHPAMLSAGYHSFRIRQQSGAFFFIGLTVWKV